MLKAIFYARFHPERGPSIIHQDPPGSILRSEGKPLISWSDISSYIIPPYDLCNKTLSICTDGYQVLAHPVSLEDTKYDRNRFTFNICFVLAEEEDAQPWEQVVRKTARFLVALEEEDGLLQHEEDLPGLKWAGEEGYPARNVGIIHGLLSQVLQDMNEYGETCARVDEVHVLNLRLEYEPPVPPRVRAWDVPLIIRPLPPSKEWTWDLTLQRIHPYIDGIRHVQRIAELADAEVKLVKRAVYELVYHGHAMVLDIFHFQAIYTCTEDVAALIEDENLQDECRRYITIRAPPEDEPLSTESTTSMHSPTRQDILRLYALLQPGQQLADYTLTHQAQLTNIDIRRLITFGTIRGFVRRIHKYALSLDHTPNLPRRQQKHQKHTSGSQPGLSETVTTTTPTNADAKTASTSIPTTTTTTTKPASSSAQKSNEEIIREFDRAWRKAALSSGWATPPSGPLPASFGRSHKSAERTRDEEDEKLRGYLDGRHCMDQICVEMHMSEKKVVERLRSGRLGEFKLFNK